MTATRAPELPLSGVKVLDLTWIIVGPSATRVLADYGATVVKVESAARIDAARAIGPHRDRTPGAERSGCWANYNAGKLGLSLDISLPEGRDVIRRLIRWADVLAESFSPRAMRNWGLAYEDVRPLNPSLIYLSSSLNGADGPYSSFAGFGNLGAALAGFNYLVGWPDRPPAAPAGAYTDYVASRFITTAILAALDYRARTGVGQHIDLSQIESAVHFLSPAMLDYEVNARVERPNGNRAANMVPHGVFHCAGPDRWIAIAVQNDEQWRALCGVLERPELRDDRRFSTLIERCRHEDELEAIIGDWAASLSVEDAQARLIAAAVPAHVVADSRDAMTDPQFAALGHFVHLAHAELDEIEVENSRFRLSRTPGGPRQPAPLRGEHNEYVLRELAGMNDDEIEELAASGALQ